MIHPYIDIMINTIKNFYWQAIDTAHCFFAIFVAKPELENLNFYEAK